MDTYLFFYPPTASFVRFSRKAATVLVYGCGAELLLARGGVKVLFDSLRNKATYISDHDAIQFAIDSGFSSDQLTETFNISIGEI